MEIITKKGQKNIKTLKNLIIAQTWVTIVSLLLPLVLSIAINISPPSWADPPGEFIIFNYTYTNICLISGITINITSIVLGINILVKTTQIKMKKFNKSIITASGVLSLLMFTSILTMWIVPIANLIFLIISWVGLNKTISKQGK